jgi:hypothetical protein
VNQNNQSAIFASMKKIYVFMAAALLTSAAAFSQTFSSQPSLLPDNYRSGGVTGVADVNHDGLDDIVVMHLSTDLYVLYQQPDGSFSESFYGAVSSEEQWGMAVGDYDNDGQLDVLSGGRYDGVKFTNINSPSSGTIITHDEAQIFMQACNFADIDNDGWADAFACHDDGESFLFRSNMGTMEDGNTMMDMTVYPQSDNSGNYGSTWTDFDRDGDIDLFIAKCRQFVNDPFDPRRTNVLMVNDGNNNYSDQAHERGLVNLEQSWTADFADVDNDGDFDGFITTHSGTMELYENDGFGYFTNVTAGSGLEIAGFFLQGKLEDMDNDGYVDLLYAGGTSGYMRNNGNMTFSAMNSAFPVISEIHSFAIGDLNDDGWMDVYTTYGTSYVTPTNTPDSLFINNGGTNHWVSFDLTGTISNARAIGAIVEIHGAWGRQLREVRAGESYGISNSFKMHFGIGANTEVDYAVVFWPSGLVTVVDNPSIDQVHNVIETECIPPSAEISAQGNTTICPGQSATLTVSTTAQNFNWNNGAETSTITVTEQGNYSVIVSDANGCGAISNVIAIDVQEEPVPVITSSGEQEFCVGESTTLTASEGNGYLWSTGEETQSITVVEPGVYSVQVQGACLSLPSEPLTITVLSAATPVVQDVTIGDGETATIDASGTNLFWYDSADATDPIATGSSFVTPVLNSSTTYWVESVTTYGGETANGGLPAQTATGAFFNNTNRFMIFDVYEDVIINSVKVYAQNAGVRTIEVRDALNNTLASGTFDIPAGEQLVNLNFALSAGTSYGMYCTSANPGMWRDENTSQDLAYPFALGTLGAITSSSVSGDNALNYYYFFYDWNLSTPLIECVSPREEVSVIVVGVDELEVFSSLSLYPNPAQDNLRLVVNALQPGRMNVRFFDLAGKLAFASNYVVTSGKNTLQADVSHLAKGVYTVQFEMNGSTAVTKLIVQ